MESNQSTTKSNQSATISWVLFWTFWGIFVLMGLGTLGMLFFGFGTVQEGERQILINAVLVETAVAIFALFYSIFKLKHHGVEGNSKLIEELEAKKEEIKILQDKLKKTNQIPYREKNKKELRYRDAIIALCSTRADTRIPDIIKQLGLDDENYKSERTVLVAEIGYLKQEGVLINTNVLYPDSLRLKHNA